MENITIRLAKNNEERQKLLDIREAVFIKEQGVPYGCARDGLEEEATAFVVLKNDKVIGGSRIRFIKGKAKLERIVLLPKYQRKGIGKRLVQYMICFAKEKGLKEIYLHGQVRIQKFYKSLGFKPRGEIFVDGGMEHYEIWMGN